MKAFGKVILLGEHAVVYGQPALAAALELGVSVRLEASAETQLFLNGDYRARDAQSRKVYDAIARAQALLHVTGALAVHVRFSLPVGAGLGSSAAFTVAFLRALAQHYSLALDDAALGRFALEVEHVFHGRSSGVDVALAQHGGVGLFTRQAGLVPLPVRDEFSLIIANSGVPRSTEAMVQTVAERRERHPAAVDATLRAIGELSLSGGHALARADWVRLGELMQMNQALLTALGVSSKPLDALIGHALEAGAVAAKLSGAGGGGCVIALAPGDEAEVAERLRAYANDVFVARFSSTRFAHMELAR